MQKGVKRCRQMRTRITREKKEDDSGAPAASIGVVVVDIRPHLYLFLKALLCPSRRLRVRSALSIPLSVSFIISYVHFGRRHTNLCTLGVKEYEGKGYIRRKPRCT